MTALRKCPRREPLTWWRFSIFDSVRVVCSRGHASTVQHTITEDGTLVAPPGRLASMHCGHDGCGESLPLKLDGWTP